jgi:hypothetical protein
MRKNWIMIGVAMATAFFCWSPGALALAQGTHPTRDFMRLKLSYNQGIAEGIVLEKYDLVLTNAASLRNMNLTNAFLALKNPDYLQRIGDFQQKVDGLVAAANEKNLDKSTEAYSQVVSSCVACHKSFRKEQFQASFRR